MLRNSLAFPLLMLALLGGCVTIPMDVDAEAELAAARKAGDHARALEIVERISPKHPQYDALLMQRESVLKEVEQHQQQRIQEASNLASSGRWQEAFALIDQLGREWRDSTLVTQARQELEQRQQLRFRQLAADVLVSESKWLLGREASTEQLNTLTQKEALDMARRLNARRADIAVQMAELGQHFAEQKDWQRTRDLLDGARLLNRSAERDPQLVTAERQLANVANRQVRAAAQRTRQRADTLIEQYRKTESIKDLIAARDYLQSNNQDGSLDEGATRLESLSRERFRTGLKRGDSLYAAGDYAAAEKIWKEVAPLYPNDTELASKMERVRRVLENLKTLGR